MELDKKLVKEGKLIFTKNNLNESFILTDDGIIDHYINESLEDSFPFSKLQLNRNTSKVIKEGYTLQEEDNNTNNNTENVDLDKEEQDIKQDIEKVDQVQKLKDELDDKVDKLVNEDKKSEPKSLRKIQESAQGLMKIIWGKDSEWNNMTKEEQDNLKMLDNEIGIAEDDHKYNEIPEIIDQVGEQIGLNDTEKDILKKFYADTYNNIDNDENKDKDYIEIYVEDGNKSGTVAIIKENGKWIEKVIDGDLDKSKFYKTYQSYLKPEDILQWFEQDFDYAKLNESKLIKESTQDGIIYNYNCTIDYNEDDFKLKGNFEASGFTKEDLNKDLINKFEKLLKDNKIPLTDVYTKQDIPDNKKVEEILNFVQENGTLEETKSLNLDYNPIITNKIMDVVSKYERTLDNRTNKKILDVNKETFVNEVLLDLFRYYKKKYNIEDMNKELTNSIRKMASDTYDNYVNSIYNDDEVKTESKEIDAFESTDFSKQPLKVDDIDNLENKLTKSQLDYIKNHICKDLGEFKTSLKQLVNDANDIAIEFSLDNYIGSFNKIIYKEGK